MKQRISAENLAELNPEQMEKLREVTKREMDLINSFDENKSLSEVSALARMSLKQGFKVINLLCNKGIFEKINYGSYRLVHSNLKVVGKGKAVDDIVRFWSKVEKTDYCWIWNGTRGKGYGYFKLGNKNFRAHRFSWELAFGHIPEGLQVLHECDNPSCVNPKHLFLGTIRDNMADMMNKHRHAKYTNPESYIIGSKVKTSKLNDEKVREIRTLYCDGSLTQLQIANIFNIAKSNVCRIVNHKAWRHVG